jgi:hypothetical protein
LGIRCHTKVSRGFARINADPNRKNQGSLTRNRALHWDRGRPARTERRQARMILR